MWNKTAPDHSFSLQAHLAIQPRSFGQQEEPYAFIS